MKLKLKLTLTICVSLLCLIASAQGYTRPETYNYQRGLEAMQNENIEQSIEFFEKDIKENPKSGYSYSWLAMLRDYQEEYGRALTAAEMAIRYLPKKDTEYVIFAYSTRAGIYLNLEDTVKALADYTTAIRINPDNASLYDKRAQIYYEQECYDLSDADYRKMIELKPGDVMGFMGLGRNANAQKNWDEALRQFNYVVKLESEYSSGYSFRAETYLGLEKWNEATDDIISALRLDWDRKAFYLASTLKEPAFTLLVSKMRVQAAKNTNDGRWMYGIGAMCETAKDYEKAIKAYTDANRIDASDVTLYRIARCNFNLGDYEQALNYINQALNMDSTDVDYQSYKANIYYEMGNTDLAIAEWDKVLTAQPEYAWGYYRRGWFKELSGDNDGALEDLSMSIVLDPEFSYAYSARGDIYLKQGKRELAEIDFRKIIELEKNPDDYECIHYAYQGLGMNDKAIEAINVILERDSTDAGNYYDAACMYSRMRDKNNALKCLERSLELGYNRFAHIDRDFDLDFIRDTEEFLCLMSRYRTERTSQSLEGAVNSGIANTISEVHCVKEMGVCKVQCQINGLPLHFVFDTGASDVTLSMVEANFMMKNGYLTANDVVGNQRYMDANGDISVGTVINLKSVTFGECTLTNVRASVVRNQRAPLLLGQSVLGRLGKIEIDNQRRVLKITHTN